VGRGNGHADEAQGTGIIVMIHRRRSDRDCIEGNLREGAARRPVVRNYIDTLMQALDPHDLGPAASCRAPSIGSVVVNRDPDLIDVLFGPPPDPTIERYWSRLKADARARPRCATRRALHVVVGEIVLVHPRWREIEPEVRRAMRAYRAVATVMSR
jgi:hypothetical protein